MKASKSNVLITKKMQNEKACDPRPTVVLGIETHKELLNV